MNATEWEVSCVDQRYDDEGFELGRSVQCKDGRWAYEIHPDTFDTRIEAEKIARLLNKEIEDGQS
jgi:hypothetical protein